jgi:hypothetical protein
MVSRPKIGIGNLKEIVFGAGARNRTGMKLPSGDFESPASTSFTTPARARLYRRGTKCQAKNC